MNEKSFQYGMIGLGTMGSNLMLNMADNGFTVCGYDKDEAKANALNNSVHQNIQATYNIQQFADALHKPRTIMMLVPAGKIVDAVIEELLPLISSGDIIIDCGNSHYTDTETRVKYLEAKQIHFMGLGVSGGELGARFGPSIMPGGDKLAYERIAPMLAAISAKVNGEPCTAYMGKGAAGHYVKMVHNGIEYALMQMLAESYHILKVHGNLSNQNMHDAFAQWNDGRLQSYLLEITAAIMLQKDDTTNGYLLDAIADKAKQKGTGAWTSIDAMKIQSPIPSIDAAVTQRLLSSLKSERVEAAKYIGKLTEPAKSSDDKSLLYNMEAALYAGFLIVYAQGMAMLQNANNVYEFGIEIGQVASIWRGGCIIRAELLDEITTAYQQNKELKSLLLAPAFAEAIKTGEKAMRNIVIAATNQSIPTPCFSSSLNYYDSYFSAWLPANLIQAQRDFFGSHTYERLDKEGVFHTEWNEKIR